MIIHLHNSKLFTVEPALRFAKEYRLPKELWVEIWKRHSLMDYSLSELCEYYEMKTGRKTSGQAIQRWLWRTYVYGKAQDAVKKGVQTVTSEYFGDFEWDVVKELTKNLRASVKKDAKVLI